MSKYVGFKIGEVHEDHIISEYYCGGCGWPVTDHDSFCPECGGAFRKFRIAESHDPDKEEEETCRNVSDPPKGFLCSECGWGDFGEPTHLLTSACYVGLSKGPRYCPNCGRKVVGE